MKNRQKASDVFKNSEFVFASKTDSFDKAFPNVQDLTVEVEESGDGVSQWNKSRRYTKQHLPGEYINCSNSLCYNGGFSIGEIIRDMVTQNISQSETNKLCQGSEGSPKGRRIYRKCINFFKVKVNLQYKTPPEKS